MMAKADILLEMESEVEENSSYVNYFQANHEELRKFPLHRIPYYLQRDISANFYWTDKKGWIEFLEHLGVDKTTIYEIAYKASKPEGDFPICLAINGILQTNNTSLFDFIDAWCKLEKFHILRLLQPFVKELLSKRTSLIEEGGYSELRPSAPNYSSLDFTCSLVDSSHYKGEYSDSVSEDTGYSSKSFQEIERRQIKGVETNFELFQNSEALSSLVTEHYKLSNTVSNSQNIYQQTSVFIMHSKSDKKYAKELAAHFKEKKFKMVLTSADLFKYLTDNPVMSMIKLDELVDFVIPVVSEPFLFQIKPTRHYATEERDVESVSHKFLYELLLNEYAVHGFCRMKPVRYLEINKLGKLDQILSWAPCIPYIELKSEEKVKSKLLRHLKGAKKKLEELKEHERNFSH